MRLRALLGLDPHDGTREVFHQEANGEARVRATADVEIVLKRNRELYNQGDGYSESRELRRVATIPPSVAMKWLTEEGINVYDQHDKDNWARVAAKLDDPENLYLRTAPGTVSTKPRREYHQGSSSSSGGLVVVKG